MCSVFHTTSISQRTLSTRIDAFIRHEAVAGLLLIAAAVCALALANSRLDWLYDGLLETRASIRIGALSLDKPVLLWVNDGLMAIFFFLVGLEIKREFVQGELSTWRQAALPAIAALGGMVVPSLIYTIINWGDAAALRGWAIPAATDIAFALAVLAVLGDRIPPSLKVFLMALAVLDDLGGIVIIAVFYTANLSYLSLALAAACIAVLVALNRAGVTRIAPYIIIGMVMWMFVLKSGVHATLAGVATALAVPANDNADERCCEPLQHLIEALHPWVAFVILPLFAFANAGVSLHGISLSALAAPIPLGIALGLLLGKQLGILAATWIAVRFQIADRPQGSTWAQVYGVSIVAGIGFTMSLFIGTLAFPGELQAAAVRIGVLAGSLASAMLGYTVLRLVSAAPLPRTRT